MSVWYNKIKHLYCKDLTLADGKTKRVFLTGKRRESERLLKKILTSLSLKSKTRSFDINTQASASEARPNNEVVCSGVTINHAVQQFMEYVRVNRSAGTWSFYSSNLKQFLAKYGRKHMAQFTAADMEEYKAWLCKTQRTTSVINMKICAVKTLCSWALDFDVLQHNPVAKIKRLSETKGKTRYLSEDEEAKLLRAADEHFRMMITVLLHTGFRINELLSLEWSNVNFDNRTITLFKSKTSNTTRNYRARTVPMTDDVFLILSKNPKTNGFIFVRTNGTTYSDDSFREVFNKITAKAGIVEVTPHTLRHSFASRLTSKGVPLKVVAELLGHSKTAMTERYAHLAPSDLQRAISVLNTPAES